MQLRSAVDAAAKRYRPVAWGRHRALPQKIQDRADAIACFFVRETFDKESGNLNIWMDNDAREAALHLMRDYGMFASYGFDASKPGQGTLATMFEASILVHMTAVAIAEQEEEMQRPTADSRIKELVLGTMPIVYKNMVRLKECETATALQR